MHPQDSCFRRLTTRNTVSAALDCRTSCCAATEVSSRSTSHGCQSPAGAMGSSSDPATTSCVCAIPRGMQELYPRIRRCIHCLPSVRQNVQPLTQFHRFYEGGEDEYQKGSEHSANILSTQHSRR
ncbi:hypothetical protein PVAP13_6KG123600 [Panicum virgatum]|uniref:Uncharacterized protein n=1 Tax=Panicum virgatum TaxID=38727 RepID=A0A8T0RB08_PANVG|nr:hypothetical protein PVAP13_6KG123600 [Panicum virgatum]